MDDANSMSIQKIELVPYDDRPIIYVHIQRNGWKIQNICSGKVNICSHGLVDLRPRGRGFEAC